MGTLVIEIADVFLQHTVKVTVINNQPMIPTFASD
jgi:hypothetical protein